MKNYNSNTFTSFKKYKYEEIKIWQMVCLHDTTQWHWVNIMKKSNDKRELFIWEFWTYWINGSLFQKWDQILFGAEKITQTLDDLQNKQESMNTTHNKRGWKWRASFWWKN